MYDHSLYVANDERLKDLHREAADARLAREAYRNDNGVMHVARHALGRGLVAVGRQLLDEQR